MQVLHRKYIKFNYQKLGKKTNTLEKEGANLIATKKVVFLKASIKTIINGSFPTVS